MAGREILIVEDEPHTRLALNIVLRQAGFKVLEAENGRQAYERLAQLPEPRSVKLIITDFKMPELDALGLLDLLRQADIAIPILVITGYGDNELRRQLRTRGCTAYIDKPFIPEEVVSRVASILHPPALPHSQTC